MSKAIDDLRNEHEAILFALKLLAGMTARGGQAAAPDADDLREFVGFLKEFADRCHHGKEEGILFPALVEAGIPEKGGPIGVMLAEHVQGREFIREMDAALAGGLNRERFTRAAEGYARLLAAHIEKENGVLFPSAERVLTAAQLDRIYEAFAAHEETVIGAGRHEALHALLHRLEEKYAG
jgi:hemerythrin-like domain-containing protein